MNGITTHVLDISVGRPAPGVRVTLARDDGADGWIEVATGRTDEDGRARLAGANSPPARGTYRLDFAVAAYFGDRSTDAFYPRVVVHFEVRDPEEHHHVPLLLSPFGYSTYRGS